MRDNTQTKTLAEVLEKLRTALEAKKIVHHSLDGIGVNPGTDFAVLAWVGKEA